MVKIAIRYRTTDGKEKKADFGSNEKGIVLDERNIASIELPLELRFLKELILLSINENHLTHIDLSPLSNCTKFTSLLLIDNQLVDIDLTPLRFLPKLADVYLPHNQLERLDVSPLSNCPMLTRLILEHNRLRELDVTPLFQCPQLQFLICDPSVALVADQRLKDAKKVPPGLRQVFAKLRWQGTHIQPTQGTDHYPESKAPAAPQTPVVQQVVTREREVREVVLVICPYCGTKNPQGTTRCSNCKGRL
jgi:hypothetical protein